MKIITLNEGTPPRPKRPLHVCNILFPFHSQGNQGSEVGLLSHTAAAATAKSLQSCPTLCDPTDGSPPGFTVPGILQARTLE